MLNEDEPGAVANLDGDARYLGDGGRRAEMQFCCPAFAGRDDKVFRPGWSSRGQGADERAQIRPAPVLIAARGKQGEIACLDSGGQAD